LEGCTQSPSVRDVGNVGVDFGSGVCSFQS